MKTKIFILFFMAFLNKSQGQETLVQHTKKLSISVYSGMFTGTPNFDVGFTMPLSLNYETSHTHHHLQIDPITRSVIFLNGYLLPKNYDVYLYTSKYIKAPGGLAIVGIEKYFQIGEIGGLAFFDGGFDWSNPKDPFLEIGVLYNFEILAIWEN